MATAASSIIGTSGATTNAYVTALNIHKPEFHPSLVHTHPGEAGERMFEFFSMYTQGKNLTHTTQTTYGWFQTKRYRNTFIVTGVAGGAAGAAVTHTLAAASHNNSGASSAVQVGLTILYPNGVTGVVTAVNKATPNAHTFTVAPQVAAESIPTTSSNDILIPNGTQFDEATNQPLGNTPTFDEYSNSTQILKGKYTVSQTESDNSTWFEVTPQMAGPMGLAPGNYVYLKGASDEYFRYLDGIEDTLLTGKLTTNSAVIGDNSTSTQGFIPSVRAGGIVRTYTAGNVDIPFWDATTRLIDRNNGADEYQVWAGLNLRQEITNGVAAAFTNGALLYNSFNGSKELAMNMGFSSWQKDGRTYHFKTYKRFNDPNGLGATGYSYQTKGLFVPIKWYNDPVTGTPTPSMLVRYKKQQPAMGTSLGNVSFNGPHIQTFTGLAIGNSENHSLSVNWACEMGHQMMRQNTFLLMEQ